MKEQGQTRDRESFWTIDEMLGELKLRERTRSPDRYAVRLKARTTTSHYRASRELYPLQRDGTRQEIVGRAYILISNVTLAVGLYAGKQPSGATGEVMPSTLEGVRHHDIAAFRSLYYQQDQAVAIWEVDAWGRLDELSVARLWQLVEQWLRKRYPMATRIFTDDAEPGEDSEQNRALLRVWGYEQVPDTHRIFAKTIDRVAAK